MYDEMTTDNISTHLCDHAIKRKKNTTQGGTNTFVLVTGFYSFNFFGEGPSVP